MNCFMLNLLLIIFEFLDAFAMLLPFLETAISLLLEPNLVCFLNTLFSKKATSSWISILILFLYLEMSFFMSPSSLLLLAFFIFHMIVFSYLPILLDHSSFVLPNEILDIPNFQTHLAPHSPEPQIQSAPQTQLESQPQPYPQSVSISSSQPSFVPSSLLRRSSLVKNKPGYLQRYHCQVASHHAPSSDSMKSDLGISYSLSSSLCYDKLSPSYKACCL